MTELPEIDKYYYARSREEYCPTLHESISFSPLVAHRMERGSAGSNPIEERSVEFDPALPRSVLCATRVESN